MGVDFLLSPTGIKLHYLLSFACFFISGTQMITGIGAALCGITGCALLCSALMRYSPLVDLIRKDNDS